MSLVEALTAIAITGIIAGVVISRTYSPRESADVVAIVQTLQGISEAATAYRGTVGRYPAQIGYLIDQPQAASDLCGRAVPVHFLQEWRGPYLLRRLEADGIAIGDAVVQPELRRVPATSVESSVASLQIDVHNVQLGLAERVDLGFDGDEDLTAGTIRWTADSDNADLGDLVFSMPIRGC